MVVLLCILVLKSFHPQQIPIVADRCGRAAAACESVGCPFATTWTATNCRYLQMFGRIGAHRAVWGNASVGILYSVSSAEMGTKWVLPLVRKIFCQADQEQRIIFQNTSKICFMLHACGNSVQFAGWQLRSRAQESHARPFKRSMGNIWENTRRDAICRICACKCHNKSR